MSDQRDLARSAPRSGAAPAVCGARGERAAGEVSRCRCSTTTIPALVGQVIVLRVAGEVDLGTVGVLRTALGAVLAQRPAHLIVDLAELGFCSVRGLAVLGQAGDIALECGVGYAVAGASAQLGRVWASGWTAAGRPIGFPTAGDAVLAALAHQAGAADRARWEPKDLITAATGGWDTAVPLGPLLPATPPVALIA